MKTTINIDSTALGTAACERAFYLTTIGSINPSTLQSEGGYKQIMGASAIYGVALHKFIDLMYKTKADYTFARKKALASFNRPKIENKKQKWLNDERHFMGVCETVWESFCLEDTSFELLEIPMKCWGCEGVGYLKREVTINTPPEANVNITCEVCKGTGIINGPSTELTFKIPFFEDDNVIINLCGTIDKLGKFVNGIFSIGDWKSTTSWDKELYLDNYALSRQLRVYRLALALMAEKNPDSTLGKIGNSNVGGFIDGIFLSANSLDVKVVRSEVFQFSKDQLREFKHYLYSFCNRLSELVECGTRGNKTGILNGACTTIFGRCKFWDVCRHDGPLGDMILGRDFSRKIYDPLNFDKD